ncbi:TetR/AcrR family transcriptional regulator [Paenibacillus sp. 1P07SE]|uniref:TetR/AcrR family transcriptional regulator n=1 Tax=Paenibacillus sp. 1P07SE TaxID=3132209 RepID=UPI0039A78076
MGSVDRRILKTREAIKKAFFELMAQKDFESITVQLISERANLNRGTFYLHYLDKFDLLDKCIEEQFTELLRVCASQGHEQTQVPSFESLLSTTAYFEEHFLFYSCMLNSKGMPSFRDRLHQFMVKGIREQLNMDDINKGLNKEILVQFMASAIAGIVEWWIHNKMPVPASELARELWALLERNQIHK